MRCFAIAAALLNLYPIECGPNIDGPPETISIATAWIKPSTVAPGSQFVVGATANATNCNDPEIQAFYGTAQPREPGTKFEATFTAVAGVLAVTLTAYCERAVSPRVVIPIRVPSAP